MKFEKGLSYKFTSLNEEKRLKVLRFLNNQSNATDAIHTLILNHIAVYGDGDIRDLQMIQPAIQNQPVQQVQVDTTTVKPVQTQTSNDNVPDVVQTIKTTSNDESTNESSTETPTININNF